MKKTAIFGMFAFLVFGLIATTGLVNAYKGDYMAVGPNYDVDRHELMEEAFDTLDYDAWYNLMTEDGMNPRVVDVVTESNFETFVLAHEAGVNGDYETASALRADLGLNDGNGPKDGTGFGQKMGQGQGMKQGQGQRMQQNNFVDIDGNGDCDNLGSKQGRGRQ